MEEKYYVIFVLMVLNNKIILNHVIRTLRNISRYIAGLMYYQLSFELTKPHNIC